MRTSYSINCCSESVNAAPHIAALFADGALAYQTHGTFGADSLLPQEQQYLTRAVPKRVREFAAGRACARAGLSQLGYGSVALPMGADRAPQWPAGATGSITHTDGFCAAVVATTTQIRALGLDAERADCVRPHLWRRICTAEELATLQASDAQAAVAAATLLFSAKEAFYKCQYTLTRQWLGFADLSLSVRAGEFTVRATRALQITDLSPGPWHGHYLREGGLVITAACIV